MTALCVKYGFDAAGRAHRLAMLGLTETDQACVEALHTKVIAPHGSAIIEEFYRYLLAREETRRYIPNDRLLDYLKQTQLAYLNTLGQDFASEAYFESRLRVGVAHAGIGLPLSLYHCAYCELQCLLMARLPAAGLADTALAQCLAKLTALDMSLAIEIYHRSYVEGLEEDINRLQASQAALALEMQRDELTGLASRRYVLDVLADCLEAKDGAGVIMADLDYFKSVNDSYGHQMGDRVLREAAARIRAAVRDADVVGRYGGEEFIVVLPASSLGFTEVIAERIRLAFSGRPMHIGTVLVSLTISLGCTHAPCGMAKEEAVRLADAALYEAKRRGRNQVVCESNAVGY